MIFNKIVHLIGTKEFSQVNILVLTTCFARLILHVIELPVATTKVMQDIYGTTDVQVGKLITKCPSLPGRGGERE